MKRATAPRYRTRVRRCGTLAGRNRTAHGCTSPTVLRANRRMAPVRVSHTVEPFRHEPLWVRETHPPPPCLRGRSLQNSGSPPNRRNAPGYSERRRREHVPRWACRNRTTSRGKRTPAPPGSGYRGRWRLHGGAAGRIIGGVGCGWQVRFPDRATTTEAGEQAGIAVAGTGPTARFLATEQEGRGVLQSTTRDDRGQQCRVGGQRDLRCRDGIEVHVDGRWLPVRMGWQDWQD